MAMNTKYSVITGLLTIAFVLVGCASGPRYEIETKGVDDITGIVFGTVSAKFNKFSKEKTDKKISYKLFYSKTKNVVLAAVFSDDNLSPHIRGTVGQEPGLFAIRLPVAEYEIYRMNIGGWGQTSRLPFTVLSGKATYLGSISFDYYVKEGKGIFAQSTGTVGYSPSKNYGTLAEKMFKKKYPNVNLPIEVQPSQ